MYLTIVKTFYCSPMCSRYYKSCFLEAIPELWSFLFFFWLLANYFLLLSTKYFSSHYGHRTVILPDLFQQLLNTNSGQSKTDYISPYKKTFGEDQTTRFWDIYLFLSDQLLRIYSCSMIQCLMTTWLMGLLK